MNNVDVLVIGAGPAGMDAAIAAKNAGAKSVLVLEREGEAGGILRQCIHNGFGLHRYKEELTGPEYAWRSEKKLRDMEIPLKLNTTVLSITKELDVTAINSSEGVFTIKARSVILAMGCRERPRGALNIPGTRPAGVYSAGMAQKLVNVKGYLPGKNAVILGSGDIGLIMARRLSLEGAKVHAVCEIMPYSSGLKRNIQQCLADFDIPLLLSHTVTEIHGKERVEGVTVCKVDERRRPIVESARYIPCDTVLLSVGLVPENEVAREAVDKFDPITQGAVVDQYRQTLTPGIFSCGNVLHVHDLVDNVSDEAAIAGESAARYVRGELEFNAELNVVTDGKIRYALPQRISAAGAHKLWFRVDKSYDDAVVKISVNGRLISEKRKKRLSPGEMDSVLLPEAMPETEGELLISLEENDG